MISGKKILAVIPARGGSKGIPLKNLRTLNGVPLVALVAPIVKKVLEIDRVVASTDHDDIARVAEQSGIPVPFRRPASLSGDRIGDWEVLVHALKEMEKQDQTRYDIVLMLQPTSPFRTSRHLSETLSLLIKGKYDSVWTVSPTNSKFHPLKALNVKAGRVSGGRMSLYDSRGSKIIARQQLNPVYHRNGLVYAFTRDCLLKQKTILGKKSGAIIVEGPLVNIDTEDDLQRAERILSH